MSVNEESFRDYYEDEMRELDMIPLLQAEKLCKSFGYNGTKQQVLKDLDIKIEEGDFTIIMGASGAGKSTLLYALSGMDVPTAGRIQFRGNDIVGNSSDKLAKFRKNNCGFIFQQNCLVDNMSLMDNAIACGLLVSKRKKEIAERAKELFNNVGLSYEDTGKFPSQLSGGEAQRGAIVRALINEPSVVFADEPTGSLNSASGKAVLDILSQIHREGRSIIMVTHDIKSALRGNRIIYIRDGIVCGECNLGEYSDDEKNQVRHEKLLAFLKDMGW